MDPESGAQPLKSLDGTVTVAANGEIYNYKDLYTEFPEYEPQTGSDCEVRGRGFGLCLWGGGIVVKGGRDLREI